MQTHPKTNLQIPIYLSGKFPQLNLRDSQQKHSNCQYGKLSHHVHSACWLYSSYSLLALLGLWSNLMFDIVFESCLQRQGGDTLQQSGCFSPQQALLASCNLLIAPDHRSFPKRLPWLWTFRHLLPDSLMLHPHVSVAYGKFSFPFNAPQPSIGRSKDHWRKWLLKLEPQRPVVMQQVFFLSRWEFLNVFNTALE